MRTDRATMTDDMTTWRDRSSPRWTASTSAATFWCGIQPLLVGMIALPIPYVCKYPALPALCVNRHLTRPPVHPTPSSKTNPR